jgi:hypothetical protein
MLKTKTERVLLFVVAFLAGCEASRLANVVVPPARAGEPVQRRQYLCYPAGSHEITELANKFGAQGWKLVTAAGWGNGSGLTQTAEMVWCFEREVGATASAPVSAQ